MKRLMLTGTAAGAALTILYTGMIAAADGITKFIAGSYAAPQLFVISSAIVVGFSVLASRFQGGGVREALTVQSRGWMLIRAVLTVVASVAFFMAFRLLQFADVFLFIALIPLMAAVVSGPILGESPRPTAWIALTAGATGVLFLMPGGLSGIQAGHLWALLAAVSGMGSLLSARVIAKVERKPLAQVFWPNLALMVAMMAALPFVWKPMGLVDIAWIVIYAAALFGARYVVAEALRLLPAYVATPLMNLQFVWMVLIGLVAFGEIPTVGTLLGVGLVILSGGWLVLEEYASKARVQPQVPAGPKAIPAE